MENSNPFALSIFDKLAQLKQWQSEQHERLIREQEQQRELLAHERELQFEEAYEKGNEELKDEHLPCSGPALDLDQHQERDEDQALGVSYLSSTSESDADSSDSEHCNAQPSSASNFAENQHSEMVAMNLENLQSRKTEPADTVKPIFSFLKRGQGLSRFRLTTDDIEKQNQRIKASKAKPGAKKSQSNTASRNGGQKNANKKTVNKPPKKPATTTKTNLVVPRSPSLPTLDLADIPPGPSRQAVTTVTNRGTEQNKALEQPLSLLQELQSVIGTTQNTAPSWATVLAQPSAVTTPSFADSNRIVEQRELRLFERLERIADDSSFCSSSSIVTKFVEGGYLSSSVQSTPQTTPSKGQNLSMPLTSSPIVNPKPTLKNARSLLEKLAAYHFAPKPAATAKKDDIKLELHPLPGTKGEVENWSESEEETPNQHRVRFKETPQFFISHNFTDCNAPQVKEVWTEQEAWSEESGSDSSTECEEETVPKELFVDQPAPPLVAQPLVQQVAQQQQHSKSSDEEEESEYSSTVDDEDEKRVMGAMVHARLEQLSQEVLVVKKQQALLASQLAEVEAQKLRLAQAIVEAEEEKCKLQAERASIGGITKKRQNQERDQLQQLTKQARYINTFML
ncbi:hypothetical protein B566_EDAN016625 [Ephemera danica]|nr:hypothetical protein B566_EDAN016625 [Ephemera danica]